MSNKTGEYSMLKKTSFNLLVFLFLISLFSVFVFASPLDLDWTSQIMSDNDAISNFNMYSHSTSNLRSYMSGAWNPSISNNYKTFMPDNGKTMPLIGRFNYNDNTEYNTIKFTNNAIQVFYFNNTLGYYVEKAESPLNGTLLPASYKVATMSTPFAIVGTSDNRPAIYVLSDTPSNTIARFVYNGTHVSKEKSVTIGTSSPVYPSCQYDAEFDVIICLSRKSDGFTYYELLNPYTLESKSTLTNGIFVGQNWNGKPFSLGYFGLNSGNNYHTIVLMSDDDAAGKGTMDLIDYNQTKLVGERQGFTKTETLFYTCTNGKCTGVSDSQKASTPILADVDSDGYDEIMIAVEDLSGFSHNNYQIYSIDHDGSLRWQSSSSTDGATAGCGSHSYVIPLTFYQPVYAPSLLDATKQVICGACQRLKDATGTGNWTSIDCWDAYNGDLLHSAELANTENYYINESHDKAPASPIISSYFSYGYTYKQLMIQDTILDSTLDTSQVIKRFGYWNKYTQQAIGRTKNFDYNNIERDYDIILWNNETARIYYTGLDNTESVIGQVDSNPNTLTTPFCSNFSRDIGLFFKIGTFDIDGDTKYVQYACDVNDMNSGNVIWQNFTNLYSIGFQNPQDAYFSCKYNYSGQHTIRFQLTDTFHGLSYPTKNIPVTVNDAMGCINSLDGGYGCVIDCDVVVNESIVYNYTALNTTYEATPSGQVDAFKRFFNIITPRDNAIVGFIILFVLEAILIFIGLKFGASDGYYKSCIALGFLAFVVLVVMSFLGVWMIVLLLFILALIGGTLWLTMTGNTSG